MAQWNYNYPNQPFSCFNASQSVLPARATQQQQQNQPPPGFHHNWNEFYQFPEPIFHHQETASQYYSPNFALQHQFSSPTTLNVGLHTTGDGTQPYSLKIPSISSTQNEKQQKWLHFIKQREMDQNFLDNFFNSRTHISETRSTPTVKIREFKELTQEAKSLLNNLKVTRNQISQAISSEALTDAKALADISKERLKFVLEQLEDTTALKAIKNKLTKRKEKREWIKRKKERQRREANKALIKRKDLNLKIDEQREAINQAFLAKKREEETKRELDIVLSEVRRKQNEVKQLKQLFNSLRELRQLRARSLESQRALYSSQKDTNYFENKIDRLDAVMQKQLADYDNEEQTLRSMMEIRQDTHNKDCKENDKKQWDKYIVRNNF